MPNNIRQKHAYVDEWKSLWEADLEAIAYNGATCDPTRVDPKVLHWVKRNCAQKPHFIKVINGTASHGWRGTRPGNHLQCQLFVPRPFVREHFKELGRVATLENGTTHREWKVSFGVPKKAISWLQGWKRVADDNHLKPGDVMVFVLVEHSRFVFHLFDDHGHLKHAHNDHATVKTEQQRQHDDSLTDLENRVKKRRLFDPDIIASLVKTEPGITIDPPGSDRASSQEPEAHSRSEARRGELPIRVPPGDLNPKPTAGTTVIGARIQGPLPDSELTVTDLGEETVSRDELGQGEPRSARLDNIDVTHRLAGKSTSTARCTETITCKQPSVQESDRDGSRKPEFNEATKTEPISSLMGGGTGGMVGGMVSAQVPSVRELPLDPLSFNIKSRRRTPTPVERKRAKEVAKAHAELLIGYRFVVVLSDSQVYRDFHVPLPERFVAESRLPTSVTRLSLVDSTGKGWKMYSGMNSCGMVAFRRKDWCIFSLHHFLEEGDVCLFQLKHKDALTISVRVFRVLQLPVKSDGNVSIHDHYDMRLKNHKSD